MPDNTPTYQSMSDISRQSLIELGARLRQARIRRGWALEDLSQRSLVPVGMLEGMERGEPATPIGEILQVLAVFQLTHEIDLLVKPENDKAGKSLEGAPGTAQSSDMTDDDDSFGFDV